MSQKEHSTFCVKNFVIVANRTNKAPMKSVFRVLASIYYHLAVNKITHALHEIVYCVGYSTCVWVVKLMNNKKNQVL